VSTSLVHTHTTYIYTYTYIYSRRSNSLRHRSSWAHTSAQDVHTLDANSGDHVTSAPALERSTGKSDHELYAAVSVKYTYVYAYMSYSHEYMGL
jgi:hypothetical protein